MKSYVSCLTGTEYRELAARAPGPTTPIHVTPGQALKLKDGDYYVGDTMILNHKRMAALKQCTGGHKFASDHYVACLSKLGEAP
jgi:hypothetical protein